MARKNPVDVVQAIENSSYGEVAAVLNGSCIFMGFGYP